jgi:hypothetical protein
MQIIVFHTWRKYMNISYTVQRIKMHNIKILQFPLPILIPPTVPYSLIILSSNIVSIIIASLNNQPKKNPLISLAGCLPYSCTMRSTFIWVVPTEHDVSEGYIASIFRWAKQETSRNRRQDGFLLTQPRAVPRQPPTHNLSRSEGVRFLCMGKQI